MYSLDQPEACGSCPPTLPHACHDVAQAYTMGLLDRVGLQHVGVAACKDLRWARCRCAP